MEKEVKDLMGEKFRVITQVFCALVLTLSLGLATSISAMGAELPSVSPTTAEYDLDDPAEVMSAITWGIASNIVAVSDDEGDLAPGLSEDYIVLVRHLIILNTYLEDKLTDIGDSVELIIKFDVGAATLTITAIGTQPSISPTTAQYDLDDPADVETTVTWGIAAGIVSVVDDEGHNLTGSQYAVTPITPGVSAHMTIQSGTYLAGKLNDIGDDVVLTVNFNRGESAIFTITATGTQPSISPATAEYDLDDSADVETTVTWGFATSIISVVDDEGHNLTGTQYVVTPITPGVSAHMAVQSGTYLAGKLNDIGDDVVLTINFNRGNSASFNITAIGTQPSISATTAQYDLDSPADVTTTITWGTASNVTSVVDDDGHNLTGTQYTLTPITPGVSASLIIRSTQYLASVLTNIGDKVLLTIEFNLGDDATFGITATGVNAVISPQTGQYNLDNPADVEAAITWGTATSVTSIEDDDGHTLTGSQYTLTPVTPAVSADLTILNSTYLAGQLTDIGDSVALTIKFDRGADATLTITAISPQTKEYDLDNPSNAVTTVTWSTATAIVSIVDDDNYTLIKDADYTVTAIDADSSTLTILTEPYIEGKHMEIGDSTILTINFNVGVDATLTIASMGTQPGISPVAADYDIISQNDVTIFVTWGSATSVVSIVDDSGYLLAGGVHYTVTPISTGTSANLTILSSTYLATKLGTFGEKLVLTISFDVGGDATLTITVPPVCFIATAAYGTPMAEEIQILRDFRDEYLLANPLGQALVDIYYRTSPSVAEFIAEHPGLKPVVRAGLSPAVALSALAVNTTPVDKMVSLGLLVLAAAAVWAIRGRRRGPQGN